jgi:hypothetical protein
VIRKLATSLSSYATLSSIDIPIAWRLYFAGSLG